MSQLKTPGVFVQEIAPVQPIVGLPTAVTAFVGRAGRGPAGVAVPVAGQAAFEAAYGPTDRAYPLTLAVADFFANGGEAAVVVRLPGDATTETGLDSALAALNKTPFNILYLSPDQIEGDVPVFARQTAAAFVLEREAMMILEAPAAWATAKIDEMTVDALGDFPEPQRSRMACYASRLQDESGSRPSGGAVAGIWARTDRKDGVWTAPAGIRADFASGIPQRFLTDGDNAALSARGLNALRSFPGHEAVIWGVRTLSSVSDTFRYVPARRLVDHIEDSVEGGLAWASTEPPSPAMFATAHAQVSAFLTDIWKAGGLMGSKAAESFYVVCDMSNNAQYMGQGVLRVDMGLAVQHTAEFVPVSVLVEVAAS
ncbi:phage tail sheath family protein [Caulobacter sp. 602-2]|uniref:Phage tail sheath family protein n=1 Tax=Caulobacter sp. 602-2 TaxID=2710887 RepID=A0A6G4QXY0_9CAUL|nr:phage tail sheath family protein [Caulobacter sp. 602-2]NGM50343.1 phage tail sheath family protein [Caulobacter sp. 602-2]